MHEMSYCEGVLEAVERRAAGRRVDRIGVRIGAVHRVVADAFEQSFQIAAAGGPAAQASTEVVVVPVQGHCMQCRHDFESGDPEPACPACGSLEVAASGGDEVILAWLQYAAPVDAEAGPGTDRADAPVPAHTHADDGAAARHGRH
jgi:hydrogenase nickel incorporation protein HypA/HybF